MERLVVHRAGEIHHLNFEREDEDLFLRTGSGIFYPIYGWLAHRVLTWLDERGFEYYWENDND